VISGKIARRYAGALFELAEEEGDFERIGGQLHGVLALIASHGELRSVFENPAVRPSAKMGIFDALEPSLSLDKLASNFLRLLIRKGRIHYLEAIAASYDKMSRERRGVVIAEVTTARTLGPERAAEIRRRLAEAAGKEIELQTAENPALLGGFVARIGGTVYDGSVENQLQRLRKRLVEE
jgi:F-type H+-transporting ATPase subunit delta